VSSTVSFLFAWPYCSVASCLLRVSSVASFWQNGSPQPHPLCIFARKQARNDAASKLPCDKRRLVFKAWGSNHRRGSGGGTATTSSETRPWPQCADGNW